MSAINKSWSGLGAGLLLLIACAWGRALSAAAPPGVTLITYNEIRIAAAPARIWPYIVDVNSWKMGPKLVILGGDAARLGAKFKAVFASDPDKVLFVAENVDVVPGRSRTIRIDAPGGTLMGFASWELRPQQGTTDVEYRVYAYSPLPATAIAADTPSKLAALTQQVREENSRRFDAELRALKRIVEGR